MIDVYVEGANSGRDLGSYIELVLIEREIERERLSLLSLYKES